MCDSWKMAKPETLGGSQDSGKEGKRGRQGRQGQDIHLRLTHNWPGTRKSRAKYVVFLALLCFVLMLKVAGKLRN